MYIFHGNNLVVSRQKLLEQIEQFDGEIIRLEANKLSLAELGPALESASLFGQNRLVVIDSLFSRRPSQAKEAILAYLKINKPQNLILWEGKKIDGRRLGAFRNEKIFLFTLPSVIFKFLDSLNPRNKRASLEWLHRCLKQEPAEIVFYLLARQVRLLIIAGDLGAQGLDRLPGWQKAKYLRQAKLFSQEKLLWLYQELLRIDFEQKTGKTILPMASQLDLLLASL